MFFILWHKGIYESLLRRVTARQKDAAYEFFMNKLIVFCLWNLGVLDCHILFSLLYFYRSLWLQKSFGWNVLVMFWLKDSAANFYFIFTEFRPISSSKPPKCYTVKRQGTSVITSTHSSSLIVLHGTLHKNRGAMLITLCKHCCKCRLAWTYKDVLILKWAMKYTGLQIIAGHWEELISSPNEWWGEQERGLPLALPIIRWLAERLPGVNTQTSCLCSGQWLTLGIPHASDNW